MNNKARHWSVLLLIIAFISVLAGCGNAPTATGAEPSGGTSAGTKAGNPEQPAQSSRDGNETSLLSPELRIGYIAANNKGTITGVEGWAQKKGYLESELNKYGVTTITIKSFPNGPNLNEAIASGSLDIGIYGDTPAIVARAAGLPTRLINVSQSGMNAWLLTRADGPDTVQELRGKKLATANGSYMARYLNGLLQEEGLEKDVTVVHLLPPDGEAALARGDIEAYAYPHGFGPLIVSKGYKTIDEAKNRPHLRGSSVTVVSEKYLEANPAIVEIWNGIRERAAREIQDHPDEFYELYAEASEYPLEVVKASFEVNVEQWPTEAFTEQALQLLEGTKTYLSENGILKEDFKLEDWIHRP